MAQKKKHDQNLCDFNRVSLLLYFKVFIIIYLTGTFFFIDTHNMTLRAETELITELSHNVQCVLKFHTAFRRRCG